MAFNKDELFTLQAVISPEGEVVVSIELPERTFHTLWQMFNNDNHAPSRLLVVSKYGQPWSYVIDLWQTETSPDYPYVRPTFVGGEFQDKHHATAWCALNIRDIPVC